MVEAAHLAREHGANRIFCVFVHPVFSHPAVERLADAPIDHLITTNTIPIPEEDLLLLREKFRVDVLDISPLLGEVIRRAHEGRSVGALFDE
jgi:ribose-phosphate pyrophosphokinase